MLFQIVFRLYFK